MIRIAFIVFACAGLLWLFALHQRRNGMFFPDRHPIGRWETTGLAVTPDDHTFTTSDNVRLHAWLFRASDPNAPVIVWCHGNAGNITNRAEIAAGLAMRGVSVFVFDWRGFGKSEGRPSENAVFRDALAAHDYVRNVLGMTSIVMYGESIGGPYAAFVAKERRGVRAVVIENSFPSLRDLGNALFRPFPLGWTAPRALRTTDWLNEAGVRVLVLHGTSDNVIPYRLGKMLFDELRVPKQFFTSAGGHGEIAYLEGSRYYAAVTAFVKQP